MTATKTDLTDKILTIILYNDYAKNPGISIDVKYSDLVIKNNEMIVDIQEVFNNPYRIEFNIK